MHLKGCKAFYLERSSCMDDGKLLTLLNQRNELALEAVSNEYGGLCRSILSNILKDTRDIEECLTAYTCAFGAAYLPLSRAILRPI